MDYTLEYPEKGHATLSFSITKEQFEEDLKAAKEATGLEDENKLREYAIAVASSRILGEAAQKNGLKLAVEPSLLSDVNPDGSVSVTINMTLVPEVELPSYTGLNFVKEKMTVTDEEVLAEVLKRIQSSQMWEKLPADAEAKEGNEVIIDFIGEKDGVPFEGGAAKDYALVLGSGTFIPGFEDQLLGARAGDERTVEVAFPEDYFEKDLAGQPVLFKVDVKEVLELVKPELNDAFIEKMKLDGVKTVDELKERARADLQTARDEEVENRLAFDILNRIAQGARMDIPEAMIESQVAQHMQQYQGQLAQYGMSMDDFLKASKQTPEEFKARLMPEAEAELRAALVLDAIAAKEQIEASDEDLKKEYELLSTVYNFPAEQLKMMIPPEAVSAQIAQRKTLDFLKKNNTKED